MRIAQISRKKYCKICVRNCDDELDDELDDDEHDDDDDDEVDDDEKDELDDDDVDDDELDDDELDDALPPVDGDTPFNAFMITFEMLDCVFSLLDSLTSRRATTFSSAKSSGCFCFGRERGGASSFFFTTPLFVSSLRIIILSL